MLTEKIKEGKSANLYLKSIDFIEIKSMSSVGDNIMECVVVELKLNKGKNVIIVCIYRNPPIKCGHI